MLIFALCMACFVAGWVLCAVCTVSSLHSRREEEDGHKTCSPPQI